MKYFEQFPQILYTFSDPSLNDFQQVTDIFTRVRMLDSIISNISVYYTYDVKDGDTPDSIASKYYSDPNRAWIILFTNKIIDPYFQWPMNQDSLETLMINNYGSVANTQITTDHIEKQLIITSTKFQSSNTQIYTSVISNSVISIDGSNVLPTLDNPIIQVGANSVAIFDDGTKVDKSVLLVWISTYEQIINTNESYRSIKLIQPGYIQQIETELQNLLNQ
jgi:hypothetical protein